MKINLPNQILLLRVDLMHKLKINSTTKFNEEVIKRIKKRYENYPKLKPSSSEKRSIELNNGDEFLKELKDNFGINMSQIYIQEIINICIEQHDSK